MWNGCKKPYNPQIISTPNNYLVVEGFINSGADSTIFTLSRTVNLSDTITLKPERNAVLTVESNQNDTYPLTEIASGKYGAIGLNLDMTKQYRLRIKTTNAKEYLSDFAPVVNSPEIDSISYAIKSNGVAIYANTHDPNNNTRYYRWDYDETWVFHSAYFSQFKSNGDTVLRRDQVNDGIYECWGNNISSAILLGSSAKLVNDVIANNPITFVPSTSEKLSSKYSIHIRQYGLTGDAYQFWQNLKKNTEQLGSIFDAQPSQLQGNIHSVNDPAEPVVGYISVGSVANKRIFIDNSILPAWLPTKSYQCKLDTFLFAYYPFHWTGPPFNQENQFFNYNNKDFVLQYIPISALSLPGQPPIGHTGSTPECVDCTLRGGNKKPAFWP